YRLLQGRELLVDRSPIQRSGHQLLDKFRVQVQSLARFYRHFFLAFAWHNVAPWPSVYASHTKVRIGSIEWLTDNGSAYIDHRTRSFARELGLEPLTTPVRSPQSNGMAESFVKTMKHNYVAYMDKSDAPTALSRLAIAFEHYNERHPHKALKYRSPREFRRNAVSST
ncbi:integrase core domain-containing protein, partial [Burkholderia multivorans]|uniref:integrase core domain-containing protein n=1 Tax=Burkholderia multivorans TaxID=87883 RepID=UPI002158E15F